MPKNFIFKLINNSDTADKKVRYYLEQCMNCEKNWVKVKYPDIVSNLR